MINMFPASFLPLCINKDSNYLYNYKTIFKNQINELSTYVSSLIENNTVYTDTTQHNISCCFSGFYDTHIKFHNSTDSTISIPVTASMKWGKHNDQWGKHGGINTATFYYDGNILTVSDGGIKTFSFQSYYINLNPLKQAIFGTKFINEFKNNKLTYFKSIEDFNSYLSNSKVANTFYYNSKLIDHHNNKSYTFYDIITGNISNVYPTSSILNLSATDIIIEEKNINKKNFTKEFNNSSDAYTLELYCNPLLVKSNNSNALFLAI